MNHNLNYFFRWLVFAICILLIHIFLLFGGVFHQAISTDNTYICLGIWAMFIFASIYTGINTMYFESHTDKIPKKTGMFEDRVKYITQLMPRLGLLGTVFGMISALYGFANYDLSMDAKKLISELTTGMYSALYTTAFGIIYSVLLEMQYRVGYKTMLIKLKERE